MIYIACEEIWKQIEINGIKTDYEVSTLAHVRRRSTQKEIHPFYESSKRSNLQMFGKETSNYKAVKIAYKDKKGNKHRVKKSLHRLVAEAFIPIPEKYIEEGYTAKTLVVDHIRDWDPKNHDDNTIYNLQWLTYSENSQKYAKYKDAYERPKIYSKEEAKKAIPDYKSKYDNPELIRAICFELLENKLPMSQIAKKYRVKKGFVNDIKLRRCWTDITSVYDLESYDVKEGQVYNYNKSTLEKLDQLIKDGKTNKEIIKELNFNNDKTIRALISKHRKKLGKSVTKRTTYSKEFIDTLHKLMLDGKTNKEIKDIMNLESSQKTYNLFAIHRKILGLK